MPAPADEPNTFKPSLWRYAGFRYVRLLAAYVLLAMSGVAVRGVGDVDATLLVILLAVFVVAALTGELVRAKAKLPAMAVTFRGDRIEGPTGEPGQRTGFQVARVDTDRTEQRDRWRWLTGHRTIWSLDGEQIRLEESAFSGAQIRAILARAGCAAPD